jgi:hypothetical protein
MKIILCDSEPLPLFNLTEEKKFQKVENKNSLIPAAGKRKRNTHLQAEVLWKNFTLEPAHFL